MRISVEYKLSGERLPIDYRRGFLSLIKTSIEMQGKLIFNRFMADYKLKPFTFSVFFPNLKGEDNDAFIVGDIAKLNISTSSLEFCTYLYNGLTQIKDFSLFDNRLVYLKKISLQKDIRIRESEVIFKTMSPVLVSNEGSSDWYMVPGDKGFNEGLLFSVKELAKEFLNCKTEFPFEFTEQLVKKKIVWHYNMHRSGFVGTFKIKSVPEILQLIYDVGLGVRRSQGFGMLEVVKQ